MDPARIWARVPQGVGTNAAVLFRAECFCEGGEDTRIPLLREVFEAFPYTPVNIDIKVNNDTLIKKVRPIRPVQYVEFNPKISRNIIITITLFPDRFLSWLLSMTESI